MEYVAPHRVPGSLERTFALTEEVLRRIPVNHNAPRVGSLYSRSDIHSILTNWHWGCTVLTCPCLAALRALDNELARRGLREGRVTKAMLPGSG